MTNANAGRDVVAPASCRTMPAQSRMREALGA